MNIETLAKRLGTDNLEQYIIDEYIKGKEDAVLSIEDFLLQFNEEINKIESEDVKTTTILNLISTVKKSIDLSYNNELYLLITKAKNFASNNSINISTEKEELLNFSKYYLAFFNFQKTSDWLVQQKLKELRNSSNTFHLQTGIVSKLSYYFDLLNDICKIDSFTWSWETFEDGLIKVFQKFNFDKMDSEIKHEAEIEILNHRTDHKVDILKTEIKDLEREISLIKGEIDFLDNFYKKFYYDTIVEIRETYFGDNLPFILNLFNFLKSNNLLSTGWSYFYSCMTMGNTEEIVLKNSKNAKFIGRVFYHLRDFLILHFKDDPEKFICSKFHINFEPLGPHFFKNHVNIKIDKELNPFIEEIDAFFEKQKKIYLKS